MQPPADRPPEVRRRRAGRLIDVLLVVLLGMEGLRVLFTAPTAAPDRPLGPVAVDLSASPPERLMLLPGVGTVRARAIEAWRAKTPIGSWADLAQVPGLGPRTVARIRETRSVRVTLGSMPP